MKEPFEPEVIKLRVPIKAKERTVETLTLQPPKFKDLIRTDAHPFGSHAADRALLSSLTGEPEILLDELAPEDVADIRVSLSQVYNRFFGLENVLDGQEKEGAENPTTADSPSAN
jgi:hypothetical protein